MNRQVAIVHMTSAHPRFDTRIFVKQCQSLAQTGFSVHLIVADGLGDQVKNGVCIHDVGRPASRVRRVLDKTRSVFKLSLEFKAALYHIHDPELIPFGLLLKSRGFKVVFDSHEDVPVQILSKPYLRPFLLRCISALYRGFEKFSCARFDAIVAATPYIKDKFKKINPNVLDVNNFPILGELDGDVEGAAELKLREVCYVGGLTEVRGIREIVSACASLKSGGCLNLGGLFSEKNFETEVKSLKGWKFVKNLGYLDRVGVREVLRRSVAGLVTLHPIPNYLDSLPVKMFEYMAAGIPVIASDFPLWRSILEENGCGVCVDPFDVDAIAGAIDYFVSNPDVACAMGARGREAILRKYNWGVEFEKLLALYASIGVCSDNLWADAGVRDSNDSLC